MEEHDLVSKDGHAESAAVAEPNETQESNLTALPLAERSLPDNSSKSTSDSDAVEQSAHSQDADTGNEGAGRIPGQMHNVEDRIEATLLSSPSGTVSHDDGLSRPRQSAHVVASARALMAADARSAAQAAVEAAAWQANPQFHKQLSVGARPGRRRGSVEAVRYSAVRGGERRSIWLVRLQVRAPGVRVPKTGAVVGRLLPAI